MPITPEERQDLIDRISDKTALAVTTAANDVKEATISAINRTMDKHREHDHAKLEADIKNADQRAGHAHERISDVKKVIIYCTGFVTAIGTIGAFFFR